MNVGAKSLHFVTPKAKTRSTKARTARARNAKATKQDLWTMLDKSKNPEELGKFDASQSRSIP